MTIQHLLFPISPFFAFGYYYYIRLDKATLGPRLDLFENNQGIQSNLLCLITLFGKEGMQVIIHMGFPLVLESYQSPHIYSPSRIGSASDDEPMRKLSLLLGY